MALHNSQWLMVKTTAVSENGMVSARHPAASEAGVAILRQGGNAIDAAVATAFAVGVVEPWMSGLGGGGLMIIHLAKTGQTVAIDYGVTAPAGASPQMYVLEEGTAEGMFPWRKTKNNEAIYGHKAICIPGTVAGLALALARFGTLDLATVLQPAIRYAEEGFPVDWFTTMQITMDAEILSRFPEAARAFFKNGFPRKPVDAPNVERIRQPDLGKTLRRIADNGPEEFYRGETARRIAAEVSGHGGLITEQDLANYRPLLYPTVLETAYRDCRIMTAPGPSGGPTLVEALRLLEGFNLGAQRRGSAHSLHLIAEAERIAFVDRLRFMGETEAAVPWEELIAAERVDRLRSLVQPERAASGLEKAILPPAGSTSHLSVIDRDRNMVSLTQTLVSRFGSRVMIPGTGILMNNAMFWFDPEPGKANSIVGGKRPLCNMAPMLILKQGRPWVTAGAAGGRRIIGALLQITTDLVDYGMDIQEAISAPRIDLSSGRMVADRRLTEETLEQLTAMGHDVLPVVESVSPHYFAGAGGVMIDPAAGVLLGGVDPFHPAAAVGY